MCGGHFANMMKHLITATCRRLATIGWRIEFHRRIKMVLEVSLFLVLIIIRTMIAKNEKKMVGCDVTLMSKKKKEGINLEVEVGELVMIWLDAI